MRETGFRRDTSPDCPTTQRKRTAECHNRTTCIVQPRYDHWAVTGRPSAITSRPQPLRWDTSSGRSFADFAVISSVSMERSVHMLDRRPPYHIRASAATSPSLACCWHGYRRNGRQDLPFLSRAPPCPCGGIQPGVTKFGSSCFRSGFFTNPCACVALY